MAIGPDYLDIYNVVVNEILGDVWLAVILGLVVIFIMAIKHKMPFELSVLFGMLWLAVIYAETNLIIIWTFIGLFVGAIFYYYMSKIME